MSFWGDKRVMVTGGMGFLGSHVVEKLAGVKPREIFAVRHAEYDLTREADVERLFHEHPADVVIHLAGLVGGILPNKLRPAEFLYINLTMGTLVLHYAWKSGAKQFVAAGAGCGYPVAAPQPLREDDLWTGIPQPESAPYSLAKRMLTIQGEAYHRQYGFPCVICIPGNIYGPHDNFNLNDAHVIPALVRKFVEAVDRKAEQVVVWGTGKASRDFVYAGDAAAGLLLAAEITTGFEVINLSGGEAVPVRKVLELLCEITGFAGRLEWDRTKPDGQSSRCMDVSRARERLGWRAETDLRRGLELTVDWYRRHQGEARK
ncbi:MAG: NAD-dependent epimerase/dehydratase family protein [Verrucomicrobia bacterium]|nr:NAD-dependent epimerase/dehydratase family protein [Verrucomicrobiota bacterium]